MLEDREDDLEVDEDDGGGDELINKCPSTFQSVLKSILKAHEKQMFKNKTSKFCDYLLRLKILSLLNLKLCANMR